MVNYRLHADMTVRRMLRSTMDPATSGHLTLESLWQYSRKEITFADGDYDHLRSCDYCVALLGVCSMHKSLEEVVAWLDSAGK